MSEQEVEECGEPFVTSDGICDEDGIYPDGKCKIHSEHNDFAGEQEANIEHGLYRSEYYESLPDSDKRFVDFVADDLLEKSYYDEDDSAMVEKCRQIAVDLHQKRRADGYIAKKGMTQENTVGFHEQYGEMTETQENVLFITKDRLSRESRLAMKDLGIFDEDSDGVQESAESLVESLSEAVEGN